MASEEGQVYSEAYVSYYMLYSNMPWVYAVICFLHNSALGVSTVIHVCHNNFCFVLCTMKALICTFGQAEGKRLTAEGGTCDEFGVQTYNCI